MKLKKKDTIERWSLFSSVVELRLQFKTPGSQFRWRKSCLICQKEPPPRCWVENPISSGTEHVQVWQCVQGLKSVSFIQIEGEDTELPCLSGLKICSKTCLLPVLAQSKVLRVIGRLGSSRLRSSRFKRDEFQNLARMFLCCKTGKRLTDLKAIYRHTERLEKGFTTSRFLTETFWQEEGGGGPFPF